MLSADRDPRWLMAMLLKSYPVRLMATEWMMNEGVDVDCANDNMTGCTAAGRAGTYEATATP